MSSENEQYHSASHCKYLTQYHIIWCPKFRYSVLKNGVDITLKQILSNICEKYDYTIKKNIFQLYYAYHNIVLIFFIYF